MTSEHPTARLDIDLGALLHNYRALQRQCPGAEIAPVVKADAYGLGMAAIAPHLARHGARTFFVARLDEGIALRHSLPEAVIYVLDGLTGDPQAFLSHNLRPVLNSAEQYATWLQSPARVEAGLHIDTGMNRLGVRPDDLAALPKTRRLSLVMSHLACGDERDHPMNARQLTAFRAASAAFDAPKSLANSAGAFLGPDYHFDLIRPGISLYGGGPFGVAHPDIRPVARLSARILQVRPLEPCETVGYGATYEAAQPLQLATIGIGYADGLLRSFAHNGFVTVNGEQRRLTGRVSMDVCSLDVTGLGVQPGNEVEILGPAQNLDAVAAASGTIGYEWLTRLGPRIPRHYRACQDLT